MIAYRAYSRGSLGFPDHRATLLYFAAAVPTVGFVHGAADLSPLSIATSDGYAEDRFVKRAARIDAAARG
jgi:hypothetical protein